VLCSNVHKTLKLYNWILVNLIGDFSTPVFETRTVAGSELLSLLTCPHTAIFTLLSIFSSLEMSSIKNLGDNTVLACEIFSSGCRPRLKNARAKAPYFDRLTDIH